MEICLRAGGITLSAMKAAEPIRYIYRWNRMNRKGQRCTVLVRGKRNSCLVMFNDGFRAVTSRNALKRETPVSLPA